MQWRLGIARRSMEEQGRAIRAVPDIAKQNIAMLWFAKKMAFVILAGHGW